MADLGHENLGLSSLEVDNFLLAYGELLNKNRTGRNFVSSRTIEVNFDVRVEDREAFAQEAAVMLLTEIRRNKVQDKDTANPSRRAY